jgi:hypothetical protein
MRQYKVFVDFNNTDDRGRIRLDTPGTIDDLCDQGIELVEGLELTLYQVDVEMKAVVEYSLEEQQWVARRVIYPRYLG